MTTSQDWERRRNRWAEYKAQQEGNAMTIDFEHGLTENAKAEDAHNTTWSECDCYDCTNGRYVEGGVEKALLEQPHFGGNGFENHAGDGPSGFDYYQDTKWSC